MLAPLAVLLGSLSEKAALSQDSHIYKHYFVTFTIPGTVGDIRNVCETWPAVLTFSLWAMKESKGIEQDG